MNTILISGTATPLRNRNTLYGINIWAAKEGEQIQLITYKTFECRGYDYLWSFAKSNVMSYFGNDAKFDDGAYTTYLDHLVMLPAIS